MLTDIVVNWCSCQMPEMERWTCRLLDARDFSRIANRRLLKDDQPVPEHPKIATIYTELLHHGANSYHKESL